MSETGMARALIIMPHLGGGGAERVMLDLLIELRRQGLPVEMLVMQQRGPRVLEAAERGVRVDYGCGATQSLPLHGLRVLLKAVRAARRSDVVVAGLDGPTTGLALLAARLTRRPCIAMVHGDFVEVRKSDGRPPLVRWIMGLVNLTSRADLAVAVSEEVTLVTDKIGMAPIKVRVIPNGIDCDRVEELASNRSHDSTPPQVQVPTVVGIGRLAPEKGFDLLIRAHVAALKRTEHRLQILGEGPELSRLVALAEQLGARRSVEFKGFLPNPYRVLAAADLLCSPSRHEGLGLIQLEAMLLQKPLIARDGPRTVLDGGRFGDLVPPEDVDALANAIVAHFESPTRLQEKAAGGEAWVRERFSIERAAREYIALFEEVARSRTAKRQRGVRG